MCACTTHQSKVERFHGSFKALDIIIPLLVVKYNIKEEQYAHICSNMSIDIKFLTKVFIVYTTCFFLFFPFFLLVSLTGW